MIEHHVSAGQNIITQGEKGYRFYVVDDGGVS
jgi:CRP-like cAMP-binding protein